MLPAHFSVFSLSFFFLSSITLLHFVLKAIRRIRVKERSNKIHRQPKEPVLILGFCAMHEATPPPQLLPLDSMLFHHMVTLSIKSPLPTYTSKWTAMIWNTVSCIRKQHTIMQRPRLKPSIFRSGVQRASHYTTIHPQKETQKVTEELI